MLQPRIHYNSSLSFLAASFSALNLLPRTTSCLPSHQCSPLPSTTRSASHAAQGRANGPKDSAGRRLGAKKSASEYVVPGNIIFKQRGTKWHPGENVGIGKDHTIYALVHGYVRYYRDPGRNPKKRYIGVALEREGKRSVLPTPANAPRRRRLGMVAMPMKMNEEHGWLESHLSENSKGVVEGETIETGPGESDKKGERRIPYQPPEAKRVSNYEVGKAIEKNAASVRPFDRSDRWLAWRKRSEKTKRNALARAAKASRKSKGKKTNKAVAGGTEKKS